LRSKSSDQTRSSLSVAIHLLSRRDYSCRALARKLTDRGFPESEVEGVIATLQQAGYLDDRRLAGSIALSRLMRGESVGRVLEQKLRQRGISQEIAREAVERGETEVDTRSVARRLLERRYPGVTGSGDRAARRRAIDFLRRRGFSYDDITHAMGWEGEDDNDGE